MNRKNYESALTTTARWIVEISPGSLYLGPYTRVGHPAELVTDQADAQKFTNEDGAYTAMGDFILDQTTAYTLAEVRVCMEQRNISELQGQTLAKIENEQNLVLTFTTIRGKKYTLSHIQSCCEEVMIEDITGDLEDLIGSQIVEAEEVSHFDDPHYPPKDPMDGSYTWTFYKLRTRKGAVTIRWYGTSNGCYSERATFERIA